MRNRIAYSRLLKLSKISYGRLYNWYAASQSNIAPVGYAVPTDANWTTLTNYITAEITAERLPNVGVGNVLKSQRQSGASGTPIIATTTHPRFDANESNYGRDSVKLSIVPGGRREETTGLFASIGVAAYFNSSNQSNATRVRSRIFTTNISSVLTQNDLKQRGQSIRFFRTATTFEQATFADGKFVEQVMDVDGNVYDMVKIGTQVWSVQNLATTRYNDGTAITLVTDNAAWAALTTPAYCNYNNDVENVYLGSTVLEIWKTLRDRA